jgi:Protein of unknown function (DUF1418)
VISAKKFAGGSDTAKFYKAPISKSRKNRCFFLVCALRIVSSGIAGKREPITNQKRGIIMIVKLYIAIWGMLLIVAAGLAVTGNFTITTTIIYGFISLGMIFMGMMSVLPAIVSTPEGRASLCESKQSHVERDKDSSDQSASALHEWLFPAGIEMGPPKHH